MQYQTGPASVKNHMIRTILLLAVTTAIASGADKLQSVNEGAYQKLIAANKGKVVLVDFWATWCKPCRADMPEIVKLEARLRAKGLKLISISTDEPEKEAEALKFAADMKVPMPAYIRKAADDDQFINAIDPKWSGALPALILYDKTGKRVRSFVGETPVKDVEAALVKLF
jgi:thiol-disulfide isomerase/thioredoxin